MLIRELLHLSKNFVALIFVRRYSKTFSRFCYHYIWNLTDEALEIIEPFINSLFIRNMTWQLPIKTDINQIRLTRNSASRYQYFFSIYCNQKTVGRSIIGERVFCFMFICKAL